MGLVDRAKNIILTPKTEWPVIAAEAPNAGAIITGYVLPLAAIPAILTLILSLLLGGGIGFVAALITAIVMFVSIVLSIYLTALVLKVLAPTFGSNPDLDRSVQLVAYAFTPSLVAAILMVIPILGWLLIFVASLYSLYVLYLGLPHLLGTPADKQLAYTIVTLVVVSVIGGILAAIIGTIMAAVIVGSAAAVGGSY